MRITLLTPEQARAVGAVLERLAVCWRRIREQLSALAKRVAETTRHLLRFAAETRARISTATEATDRCLWCGTAHRGKEAAA
jgi:hypothetical protein